MLSINAAIMLVTLISSARAVEQNTAMQTDTAPIENPPLPRPRPSLLDVTGDNPAVLISAFRYQHGEGSVAISASLTRIAQEQANAMAMRDSLDHNVLAPFSNRIGRSGFSRAAENIAYGHADFASTLNQWINFRGTSRQSAVARREVDRCRTCTKWPPNLLGNGHRDEIDGAMRTSMSAFGGIADIGRTPGNVCF
jgi:hypothetical protein